MSTQYRYVLPLAETRWRFPATGEVCFTWDYDARSDDLLRLYAKGKQEQWDAATRIDWSLPVDPEDPMQMADEVLPLWNTPLWAKLSERQRAELRYHSQVFNLSQFLHGEQGALVCAARIVQDVPRIESKFYAATQVMDEARHVEAYRRLLAEKFRFVYPISGPLRQLIEQAMNDPRWDFTYLGMQVLIEGLALVAFQRIRDYSRNPLCQAVNAYVMQDEARHVTFGRMALREYYPHLSDAERAEREEFVVEALYFMRDRFNQAEVWQRSGLPVEELMKYAYESGAMKAFRTRLFTRIVPILKEIGLFGPKVQKALGDMGVMEYANIDVEKLLGNDLKVAEDFDAKKFVNSQIAAE
jgi:hypothetical protein